MVVLKWLGYDQVFRQQAAATKLIDWSTMKIQPYNFHADGAFVHSASGGSLSELPEPSGAGSSQVICQLWKRGRCLEQFASCWVTHRCAALVWVLTMRWNAQVVLTKHLCSIANADLLLLPPYLRPPRKAGVSGCALLFSWLFFFYLVDLLWLPLVFLPDSWPLVSCVT